MIEQTICKTRPEIILVSNFISFHVQVNTAIMGNWWPAKGRGLIFGMIKTLALPAEAVF